MLPVGVQANLFLFPPCLSAGISQVFLAYVVSGRHGGGQGEQYSQILGSSCLFKAVTVSCSQDEQFADHSVGIGHIGKLEETE